MLDAYTLSQVFCIVMECTAACFFGLVLGELQVCSLTSANKTDDTTPDTESEQSNMQRESKETEEIHSARFM